MSLIPCMLVFLINIIIVMSNPIDEESLNALPHAIRQSPSPIVRIINSSSSDSFHEEAMANMSSALSNTSLADIENDNLTHSLQLKYRERKKQERIIVIQAQILHRLRMNRQPNISVSIFSEDEQKKIALLFEKMRTAKTNGYLQMAAQGIADPFMAMQRLQSFYPSCSLPNNTGRAQWEAADSFRIYYDTPFSKQSSDSEITVMMAKLRLYKITGNSDPNYVGWSSNQDNLPRYNELDSLINTRAANGINVNVYQFMRPVRPNRKERKRLIDTRTVAIDYQGWVEFNVIKSLTEWLYNSSKNFGFGVEVEDAYGNKLNPNLYFQNMNCSFEAPAQDPPFPNIMELHPEMGENDSSLFDNETYPTLDLQTADIPRDFSDFEMITERLGERVIRKRSNRNEFENECHREEVYITFAELGLDSYILWPQGIMWTYCEGGCKSTTDSKETFYSRWMQKLFRIKPREQSRCVQTEWQSLTAVLYDGEGEISQVELENFVPTNCACSST